MTDELVHLDVARGIATITLDSPHNRNALSRQLVRELDQHLQTAYADDGVRAVLLTATGTVFCAGADLKEQAATDGPPDTRPIADIMLGILEAPKPVVTRLNGHTRAGGTGIVGASDVVIAPRGATFAFPEVRIGVAPAMIAVTTSRQMSPRSVSRYFLTGETIDADEAARIGLVTTAVDPDDLDAATEQVLDSLRLASPKALAATKRLLRDIEGVDVRDAFDLTAEVSAKMFASADAREGIGAFLEKRQPSWVVSAED